MFKTCAVMWCYLGPEVELPMRILLSAGVCLIALYAVDAYFCGGLYFDAVHQMAVQFRQQF